MMKKTIIVLSLSCALLTINFTPLHAQVQGSISQKIKWLSIGSLQQWFSNGGAEIEYGRRGRGQYLGTDQIDGLGWPAEYGNRVYTTVGNSLWIGTTNFTDPAGKNYQYKVISSGRRFMYMGTEIFPEDISLVANADHPSVYVDLARASDREFDDAITRIDLTQIPDRIVYNTLNTPIGITVKRNVLAFSQQYNDNYIIYEYVFKNTGVIDDKGTRFSIPKTLTGVVFHWQHRYALSGEAYRGNWAYTGTNWGLNTINDCVGQKPGQPNWDGSPYEFRAIWAWYGPHSASPGWIEDIGMPNHTNGSIMAGTQYAGVVVLHADRSPADTSDDPLQPTTTWYNGSDQGGIGGAAQTNDQYDSQLMTNKYLLMTGGHPAQTHAQAVGTGFADKWTSDAGGVQSAQGFGPYTLAPGDSIRIVVAEAVAGINRDKNKEVVSKWFNNSGPFVLPNGSTTTDRNVYKQAWVFTGKDSLFQTFRRAIANYRSGYQIPKPPPPPSEFKVNSGGNRISLEWSANADSWPKFNGYRIYRTEGRTDTTFQLIFSCDKNNVVHAFDDKNARRGFSYYYYIVSKSDGTDNPGSVSLNIPAGEPLVSSKFYTMTNHEAFLTRPPGSSLSEVRVVPNPFNIRTRDLQFGQNTPDRLAFYGLPPYCDIKIFTENGDLIETINHTNGSGDELWHSLTSSKQIVVSGLYIAYFEVTQDTFDDTSKKLLFKKGDNIYRKFIIIR